MQTYEQMVRSGETWSIHLAGKYFRVISAPSGPIDVLFFRNGIASGNASGVGAGYWSRPTDFFSRIEITSSQTQSVKIAVADGDGGYDVVGVTGSVSMINDDVRRAIAGQEFSARLNANAAGAGNQTFLQLWNAPGSGRNLIVKTIGASCSTAGQVTIRGTDSLISGAQAGLIRRSKFVSASSPEASVTTTRVLQQPGLPADTGILMSMQVPAGLALFSSWRPEGEVIVGPGAGLLWSYEIFNASGAYAYAEWAEIPV